MEVTAVATSEDNGSDDSSDDDEWDPQPATLHDSETRDDTHASRMTEQRRQILEDDSLPEDVRERVRAKVDDAHDEMEAGDE